MIVALAAPVAATAQGSSPPAPPVLGQSVNALGTKGTVRIRLPGTHRYVRLEPGVQLPLDTIFDTSRGRVSLQAASDASGGTQQGWFYGGRFTVAQHGRGKPITTLRLVGPQPRCGTSQARSARHRRHRRRLWGDSDGRFRTRGRFSAATVRGTKWLTVDRCAGTLTRVERGEVLVRDFARHRTVRVRAGERYLARAPRRQGAPGRRRGYRVR